MTVSTETIEYQDFLQSKAIDFEPEGLKVDSVNKSLFDWQADVTIRALNRQVFCLFEDCGLGKTPQELAWAYEVLRHRGHVLIVTPLSVAPQTVEMEQELCGIESEYRRDGQRSQTGITVTNYEMLGNFCPDDYAGIVVDESSILKSYTGKVKKQIVDFAEGIPFKLAGTATPAPNDYMELLNHAAYLQVMQSHEALLIWFINDSMSAGTYRLKKHAEQDFWRWVSTWAVCITKPSDIGYSDDGYELPPLQVEDFIVPVDWSEPTEGLLFRQPELSATSYHKEKRLTAKSRAEKTADLVRESNGQHVVWCETNQEADENYYQAIRRFYRYGQPNQVNVNRIIGETEKQIIDIVNGKESQHRAMKKRMIAIAKNYQTANKDIRFKMDYEPDEVNIGDARLLRGDCVEEIKEIPDRSIGFSIFSPPFSNLYIYSDSYRDMGNCKSDEEFLQNFEYLIPEIYRITMNGRLCVVHCKDLMKYKNRDGVAGLKDFPGEIIRLFEKYGWSYHSRVTIWKDPVIEMQRTKSHGLLYKQLCKDSTYSRQGCPDYLVVFRKWADENDSPVTTGGERFDSYVGDESVVRMGLAVAGAPKGRKEAIGSNSDKRGYSIHVWQRYASPVWFDIQQTNVLNIRAARDDKDEKHICPLQLDVIEHAVKLWSNEGDTVFSPFLGIGSEGYISIKTGRKFVGIELKDSYFEQAVKNIRQACNEVNENTLFGEML